MNVLTRGVRNAFRNKIRTFSIVVILGLTMGMALAMLIARQAVTTKIGSVKSSVGNTVSISPAGVRGFEGGGTALTAAELAKVTSLAHVTASSQTLSDRLTTTDTNLQSAVEAGDLGRRFAGNNGTTSTGSGTGTNGGDQALPSGGTSGSATGTGPGTAGNDAGTMRTFTPSVTVVGTTDPSNLSSTSAGGTFKLASGKLFTADSTENVAVVGSTLATKNSLKVGSTFTAYAKTITVVGIFDAGNSFSNNQLLMPLKTLQTLSDQAGAVTSATLTVDSITNVTGVSSAASKALGTAADVTNTSAEAESAIKPLENIQTISLYSLIGATAAGTIIILLTMIMIVRERRREIGVIKAIGASNVSVMGQFASEAVTLTMLGAIIGIILGAVAGSPITKLLVNNASSSTTTAASAMGQGGMGGPGGGREAGGRALGAISRNITNVTATVGWEVILYGLLVALLIAIIGSALASFFIAKVRPAEVMRAD